MKPSRREILRAGAISSASLLTAGTLHGAAKPGASAPGLTGSAKPFRIAHLTDMHVQPERRAGEGYLAALASLEKLTPRADLIVTGGDHIMDSTESTLDRARQQWDVYARAIAATKIPVKAVLGNHDIFGWGLKEVGPSTVGYGRAMALDKLAMERPYYSFDAGGWSAATGGAGRTRIFRKATASSTSTPAAPSTTATSTTAGSP